MASSCLCLANCLAIFCWGVEGIKYSMSMSPDSCDSLKLSSADSRLVALGKVSTGCKYEVLFTFDKTLLSDSISVLYEIKASLGGLNVAKSISSVSVGKLLVRISELCATASRLVSSCQDVSFNGWLRLSWFIFPSSLSSSIFRLLLLPLPRPLFPLARGTAGLSSVDPSVTTVEHTSNSPHGFSNFLTHKAVSEIIKEMLLV